MKKFSYLSLVIFAALLFAVPAFAKETKIGYVNLQKALNESDAGVKARDYLQKEADLREKELTERQEVMKGLKEEIDKKSAVWNKDTREKKENEFREKADDFQQLYMKLGEELNQKKKETEAGIIEDLTGIVTKVAKDGGYDYIFERVVGGLLVAPDNGDLTDKVIEEFNKANKKK